MKASSNERMSTTWRREGRVGEDTEWRKEEDHVRQTSKLRSGGERGQLWRAFHKFPECPQSRGRYVHFHSRTFSAAETSGLGHHPLIVCRHLRQDRAKASNSSTYKHNCISDTLFKKPSPHRFSPWPCSNLLEYVSEPSHSRSSVVRPVYRLRPQTTPTPENSETQRVNTVASDGDYKAF